MLTTMPQTKISIKTGKQGGFGLIEALLVLLIIAALGTIGWYVWYTRKNTKTYTETTHTTKQNPPPSPRQTAQPKPNEVNADTATWQRVNSVGGAFSVKVPGGWQIMNFAGNSLNGDDVGPAKTTKAVITTDTSTSAGDQRRFNISLNNTPLPVPQWQTPNPNAEETVQAYSINNLAGKRYTIKWLRDADGMHKGDQIFQYVATASRGRQLSVVYRQAVNDPDNLRLVEQVVQTIIVN